MSGRGKLLLEASPSAVAMAGMRMAMGPWFRSGSIALRVGAFEPCETAFSPSSARAITKGTIPKGV